MSKTAVVARTVWIISGISATHEIPQPDGVRDCRSHNRSARFTAIGKKLYEECQQWVRGKPASQRLETDKSTFLSTAKPVNTAVVSCVKIPRGRSTHEIPQPDGARNCRSNNRSARFTAIDKNLYEEGQQWVRGGPASQRLETDKSTFLSTAKPVSTAVVACVKMPRGR